MKKAVFNQDFTRHVNFLRIPDDLKNRIKNFPARLYTCGARIEDLARIALGSAHDKYKPDAEDDEVYSVWTYRNDANDATVSLLIQSRRSARFTVEYDTRNVLVSEIAALTQKLFSRIETALDKYIKNRENVKEEVEI